MSDSTLGRLERVEVRRAWEHEAQDFTPWLAENLGLLGEKLGLDLELEDTEVSIGSYRADIVARNSGDDSILLIENQLETADLKHLGQILAYMAGLNAQIVVWVATGFSDIHRSAIRWLNEHSADPFAFFAVQVSVVCIGDSQLAPVFDVLERPNEWERSVQDSRMYGEISELGQFRREFWQHFARRVPDAPGLRLGYARSNVWLPVEEVGLRIVQYLARDCVGIYLIGMQGELDEDVAPRVEPYIEVIRSAIDETDAFYDNGQHRCVAVWRIDTKNRAHWDKMVDWLDDHRRRYEKILSAGPPKS